MSASGVTHFVLGPMPARQFIDDFFSSKLRSFVPSAFKQDMFKELVEVCTGGSDKKKKEKLMYQPFVSILYLPVL